MFFSLNGPLHDLSDDYLFSAHMVQHLVLTLVVTPLLIIGTPGWMLRPALRVAARRAAWRAGSPGAGARFAIFNVVIAGVAPAAAVQLRAGAPPGAHRPASVFLVASVLMWWPLLSPLPELPRLSYPGQMLYLFLMSIPMSIVAVYITLRRRLLYPAYASAPRDLGASRRWRTS